MTRTREEEEGAGRRMTKHIRTSDKHTHKPGIYSILFYRGQGNDRLSVTALLLFPGRGTMLGRYSARQGNIALRSQA